MQWQICFPQQYLPTCSAFHKEAHYKSVLFNPLKERYEK